MGPERAGAGRLGYARDARGTKYAGATAGATAAGLGYAGRAAAGPFRHAGTAARLDVRRAEPAAGGMGRATLTRAFTTTEPARRLGNGDAGRAERCNGDAKIGR